jgi:hypothetical protein
LDRRREGQQQFISEQFGRRKLKLLLLTALLGAAALPASAQVASIGSNRPTKAPADPNKKICERVEETGTRLGSRRVCMTAAEWQARRASDRTEVERAQQNPGYKPAG